jgi:hypothetical protein
VETWVPQTTEVIFRHLAAIIDLAAIRNSIDIIMIIFYHLQQLVSLLAHFRYVHILRSVFQHKTQLVEYLFFKIIGIALTIYFTKEIRLAEQMVNFKLMRTQKDENEVFIAAKNSKSLEVNEISPDFTK